MSRLKPLQPPDAHHLQAAQGWLELGNWQEANAELENITPELRVHPDVLRIRWHVYASAKHWHLAVEVTKALTTMLPNDAESWLGLACSECQMGRLGEAKRCLEKALDLDTRLRLLALEAPDLEPLWRNIGKV